MSSGHASPKESVALWRMALSLLALGGYFALRPMS